jgi:hypothetical protein
MPENLQDIIAQLSHPAPLLEDLMISGGSSDQELNPTLATTLFDGDLSSLHRLQLQSVCSQLPWRNMANLTSLSLGYILRPKLSIGQFLDFFEGAPRLLEVDLTFATPVYGAQNGRLVSLAHLRRLRIYESRPPSLLLDHLLIPAGVKMTTELDSPDLQIEDHLPSSLDNLRNLSNFTKICLHSRNHFASTQFTGPNGRVSMTSISFHPTTCSAPRSLALLDTSKTKRLEIINSDPLSEDLHRALLSMNNLRTLTLSLCKNLPSFILVLGPDPNSMNPIACPILEALVFRTEERFEIERMVEVASARALGGVPFKSVRIINRGELVLREGVMELLKHVSHVETSFETSDKAPNYGDDGDEGE